MSPDFFLELMPGEDLWAIEDEHGNLLLYFKTETACRISLQFGSGSRIRNTGALMHGMAWIEAMLRSNNFRQILFNTDGSELRNMATRRMGFREGPRDLVKGLVPIGSTDAEKGSWKSLPQSSNGRGELCVEARATAKRV
jgi:hypothetical protein